MQRPRSVSLNRLAFPLVLSLTFLSACGHDTGNCRFLPLREYGEGFKETLANELSYAPAESATIVFVADSIQLRDAVRACKGEKP
jgi:hypothetical protein